MKMFNDKNLKSIQPLYRQVPTVFGQTVFFS